MWYGLFAPKGTPQPIVDRLNREVAAILNAPEAKKRVRGAGPRAHRLDAGGARARSWCATAQRWADVVAKRGIQPE